MSDVLESTPDLNQIAGQANQVREQGLSSEHVFDGSKELISFLREGFSDGRFWQGIGGESCQAVQERIIPKLAQELNCSSEELEQDFTDCLGAARKLCQQAFVLGKTGKQIPFGTIYHMTEIGESAEVNAATGHIEAVMTNYLRTIFTWKFMVGRYEAGQFAPGEQDLLAQYMVENLGEGWQETVKALGRGDVKKGMVMAGLHEAGEWWPRMLPMGKLNEYKKEVIHTIQELFPGQETTGLTPRVLSWKASIRKEITERAEMETQGGRVPVEIVKSYDAPLATNIDTTPRDWETGFVTIKEDGNLVRYWFQVDFDIQLPGGEKNDLKFSEPFEMEHRSGIGTLGDKKIIALSRALRAADLMQVFDDNYSRTLKVKLTDGSVREVMLSSALLYLEFTAYMPHALPAYEWNNGVLSASMSKYFLDKFVLEFNVPVTLLRLMDQAREAQNLPPVFMSRLAELQAKANGMPPN